MSETITMSKRVHDDVMCAMRDASAQIDNTSTISNYKKMNIVGKCCDRYNVAEFAPIVYVMLVAAWGDATSQVKDHFNVE